MFLKSRLATLIEDNGPIYAFIYIAVDLLFSWAISLLIVKYIVCKYYFNKDQEEMSLKKRTTITIVIAIILFAGMLIRNLY